MPRPCSTVYILWGEGFDEMQAVLMVTALRSQGIRVKVVAVQALQAASLHLAGRYGLRLQADFTLDQALAQVHPIASVLIPCEERCLALLQVDPRIGVLLAKAGRVMVLGGGGCSG